MRAILVDDEPLAAESLVYLIQNYAPNDIEIVAVCHTPEKGIEAIKVLRPDVVFLDIDMPSMTGFQMLEALGFPAIPFRVIFCTGHSAYAERAFIFSALHFLVKPVQADVFVEAIQRLRTAVTLERDLEQYRLLMANMKAEPEKIVLKNSEKTEIIPISDVLYLKASGNFTEFFLKNPLRRMMILQKIGSYGDASPFYRLSRSYSVNPTHIKAFDRQKSILILSEGVSIELPQSLKKSVQTFLLDFWDRKR